MGRPIKPGSVDQSTTLFFFDDTTFLPVSVDHATAGLALWYRRQGGLKTPITPVALASLDAAHADGGVEPISDGYSRVDLPDAAVATGADDVTVGGSATGIVCVAETHALNFITEANVKAKAEEALQTFKLDKLIAAAIAGGDVSNNSALAKIVSKAATANWDTFVNTTDSLEAVRDKWTSAMAEAYAADGADPTPEQALYMLLTLAGAFKFSKTGTTVTATKKDKVNTAMTFTLNDSEAPTEQTRST